MEEILASIRKIIAEDSSGLRASSVAPRPGTPYAPAPRSTMPQQPSSKPSPAPAPTPQRGFMTREAFLKSSQPQEPEPTKEAYTPLGMPRPAAGDTTDEQPASRSRAGEEAPLFEKPSFRESEMAPLRKATPFQETVRARDDIRSTEPARPAAMKDRVGPDNGVTSAPSRSSTPRNDPISAKEADEPETIETVEVVAIEDALQVVKEDASSVLKAHPEPSTERTGRTDTASIEAQLSELLSEDLNALREGRARAHAEENAAKAEEAKTQTNLTPRKDPEEGTPKAESSDPFAFDLGPSPFAAKSEPPRPAPAAAASEASAAQSSPASEPAPSAEKPASAASPTPAPEPVSESKPAAPAPSAPEPAPRPAAEIPASKSTNGTPYFGPFVPAAGSSASTPPPKSEPEAPAARSRQTFAVPSVSATLGPSRKLEPLSNAFQPIPPPPSAMETFSPMAESEPELPRVLQSPRPFEPQREPEHSRAYEPSHAPEPSPEQPGVGGKRDETVLHSMLPATTSESSLDRPMEDAVADLLRPLLKTWLAENMPKIVERALRREMSERLLPSQKNPRD